MDAYRRQLEEGLAALDSVASIRVVLDDHRIGDVTVVVAAGFNADATVREVRVRAAERFGAVIDPLRVTASTIAPVTTGR